MVIDRHTPVAKPTNVPADSQPSESQSDDMEPPPIKLPPELDNPIDVQIYRAVAPLSDIAHRHCLTPNHITTLSLLGGLLAIFALRTERPLLFVLGYSIAYICDSLDGYLARKYGQCTEFGDYYDHVKDTLVHVVILWCLFRLARRKRALWVFVLVILALYISLWHLKLMDDYHCAQHADAEPSPTLNLIQHVMPDYLYATPGLLATRWFGLGTFAAVLLVAGAWLAAGCKKE